MSLLNLLEEFVMFEKIRKMKNKKGFTLVELIVVLVILAILAALLVPAHDRLHRQGKPGEGLSRLSARMVVMATQTLIDEQYGTVKLADTQKLKADVVISASESTDIADDGTVTVNKTDIEKLSETPSTSVMAQVQINTTAGNTPIAKITQFKYGSNGKTCTYDGTKGTYTVTDGTLTAG